MALDGTLKAFDDALEIASRWPRLLKVLDLEWWRMIAREVAGHHDATVDQVISGLRARP